VASPAVDCWEASSVATTTRAVWRVAIGVAVTVAMTLAVAAGAVPVQLENMTWPELRERVAAGATVVLVPIGGTEQNGVHMALGKHNRRVSLLAERIARQLGNAVVAPVVAYVPEGRIEPPTEHMRWPGTISVPESAFESSLEGTARSLQRAGLTHVVLLGDHGGYRKSLDRVAARVPNVHALPEYYRASTADFAQVLRARGFSDAEIGRHAGLSDTSLMLALDASLVRAERLAASGGEGADGDSRRADAALAREAVDHVVDVTVAAIRARTGKPQSTIAKP
jgi:creatinine amidohydrolase/Fe(II)-dependent formamide hydrolase-like protein